MGIKIRGKIPGAKSRKYLKSIERLNLGWGRPAAFVQGTKGEGCYVEDLDGNRLLDFSSQICTNPLGYNHPDLKRVVREYGGFSPIKIAGQDFTAAEHVEVIEELVSITPGEMDSAMIVNSGAEAVENCMKLALRKRRSARYGVSFESAFHGRTLGALSMTNSKSVQKEGFPGIPAMRLPFGDEGGEKLVRLIEQEGGAGDIGFVIVEAVQGEGGYNVASLKMMREIRKITKSHGIPLICDEVQAGMGRTGRWWAYENFGITPDLMSSAKALQVGAAIGNKKKFGVEPGALSSTWGGGQILDLAMGAQTIKTIKKDKLLRRVQKMGRLLRRGLAEMEEGGKISSVRGLGLMNAFDLGSSDQRNSVVLEMLKNGVVVLGTGKRGIRAIPPYIVGEEEIEEFLEVLYGVLRRHAKGRVTHSGGIARHLKGSETHT